MEGKPQRRTFFARGYWWAVMASNTYRGFTIWRFDDKSNTWTDTLVRVDGRPDSAADVLYTGSYLFVGSHIVAGSSTTTKAANAYLYRFSYNAKANSWTQNWATTITKTSLNAMTIAQESTTNRILAAFTFGTKPYIAATKTSANGAKPTFGSKFVITWAAAAGRPAVTTATSLSGDDTIAITSRSGVTTVVWSNQKPTGTGFYVARHKDGSAANAWTSAQPVSGPSSADNHISLQALNDGSGRVYAVIKTSKNDLVPSNPADPLLELLKFTPNGTAPVTVNGTWTKTTVTTVKDGGTRPSLVLNRADGNAWIYYSSPADPAAITPGKVNGTIWLKKTSLATPQNLSGNGTVVMQNATADRLNDTSGPAGDANARSGIVEIAVQRPTATAAAVYYTSVTRPTIPSANFKAADVSVNDLAVKFTDTSTWGPTSWSWNFGDGTTSTVQSPSHTYAKPGKYTVTLTVGKGSGTSTISGTISANKLPNPPAKPTVAAKAGRKVTVTVTRGTLNGGAFVKTVTYCTSSNGGATKGKTITATAITNTFSITGLTAGKRYTCYAYTWTNIGRSANSTLSAAFTAKA